MKQEYFRNKLEKIGLNLKELIYSKIRKLVELVKVGNLKRCARKGRFFPKTNLWVKKAKCPKPKMRPCGHDSQILSDRWSAISFFMFWIQWFQINILSQPFFVGFLILESESSSPHSTNRSFFHRKLNFCNWFVLCKNDGN